MAQEGETYNLYEQDFADVFAYATTLAGKLFFENVQGGAVWKAAGAYTEEKPTIAIGKFIAEQNGRIELSDALTASPVQMRKGQAATDYSALDCLRALYFEVRELSPTNFASIVLPREKVVHELSLENT